jgi:hypothetical protein
MRRSPTGNFSKKETRIECETIYTRESRRYDPINNYDGHGRISESVEVSIVEVVGAWRV